MPQKFNQTAGNHWRIDPENVDFDDFQAKSRIYLLNGSGYYEVPRAKNVWPFVYKPHNICLEVSHMVCATTFSMIFLKADGFCIFDLDYSVFPLIKLEVKTACGCGLLNGNFCP